MAREFKDRVQDTTQTTGTGAFTLDAATIVGFRTFGSAHTVGATLDYFVSLGSDWEAGTGTLTDAVTITRTTVNASSNAGVLVNFGSGSKTIFETVGGATMSSISAMTSRLAARTSGQVPQFNGVPTSVPIVVNLTPAAVNAAATSLEQNVTVPGLLAGDILTRVIFDGAQTTGIALKGWRIVNAAAGTVGLMFSSTTTGLVPYSGNYTFSVARMSGGTNLPHLTLVGAGANTAALTTTTLTGTVQNIPLNNAKIRVQGRLTDWTTFGANYAGFFGPWNTTAPNQGNAGQAGTVMKFDFMTDANKIELIVKGTSTAGTYPTSFSFFRILVDGKIVTPDAFILPGNTKTYRVLLDFTQGGTISPANTPRRIHVEASTSATIMVASVVVGSVDTVWQQATDVPIRSMVFGDSFVEGYLLPQQWTAFSNTLGYLMGWDENIISGVGGTGYLKKIQGSTLTWRERITDITAVAPDVCVVMGSINDVIGLYTAAQVQAEAVLFWQQLTAALPNTLFFVAGIQISQPSATATSQITSNQLAADQNAAIKSVVAAYPNCRWVEMNDPADLWITGAGTVAAPTGAGNSDRLINADMTHPVQAGHDYYATRWQMAIRKHGKTT